MVKQVNSGRKVNAALHHIVVHRRIYLKKRMKLLQQNGACCYSFVMQS